MSKYDNSEYRVPARQDQETLKRQAARIVELERALHFYAEENHMACDDPKHNRLYFGDCDHPDCIKARNFIKGAS
jgi:hypothetical protein